MTGNDDRIGMSPLIIDVDTGVDDAIALALAVARGAWLIGVTTVAGNVPIETATRNTLDVLAHLGRHDVPVHRGASRPLVAPYQDAMHVHGDNGLGGATLERSGAEEGRLAGPAFIIRSAAEYSGELTVVTLGPLTNLAIALNVRPEITTQIARVIVMGGAYFVPGNVTAHSEFNIYVDPEAAQQVFNAPWRNLTLVGLDVTHQTVLAHHQWAGIPLTRGALAGLVRDVMRRTFTERAMSGFYLHDPLALAIALQPNLVEDSPHVVEVDGWASPTRGRTRATAANRGPNVAMTVDAERFVDGLSEVLGLPAASKGQGFERAE